MDLNLDCEVSEDEFYTSSVYANEFMTLSTNLEPIDTTILNLSTEMAAWADFDNNTMIDYGEFMLMNI